MCVGTVVSSTKFPFYSRIRTVFTVINKFVMSQTGTLLMRPTSVRKKKKEQGKPFEPFSSKVICDIHF